VLFVKSEDLGRSSVQYPASMDNQNLTLTEWDRRKGRKRKRPSFLRACHVDRREYTSCGIHIDLEYKFVGAHDG
jgi:hypothetical protein